MQNAGSLAQIQPRADGVIDVDPLQILNILAEIHSGAKIEKQYP